ncbi:MULTISPECIES: MarR family winged helix-turn-helix transcriptional regulator [Brevibacillus]|jgi:MarR family 2-MHQ and catechol resistance regulon transcriptional repressor|uniref:Transcriptional regulator n=2 Tax=Bacillales TaxID=1385 RepID=M8DDK0_9BACL|nr:MarR family transcriptional regulator [Brevibacillus borstelensis]EMT51462.1 transcriptional regulator [Brevibacillus borstelensis AK1]KKX54979.1 MarR family transcriptional regulator [Brevibacillus borstelensis cifa_chp40]MBE5396331.1 MarR family transcriptional regulator [Brevibacillus borstelensis]MCC0564367.1 MarR family transcriptional regulator [Brevibacillus borstelensis]MCM3472161.1 MarR family transcriptional regulator [Brevibacillus borstelensis]
MPEEQQHRDDSLLLMVVLARAYNWVTAHTTREIRQHGLNPTEFGVLEVLYHKGPQPLQQIGEKILISSGNITYVVDKLEKKQLLVRKPCAEDRRVIYAELTEKGQQFLASIFPSHKIAIEQAVSGLNPEEKRSAIELLKKLGHSAQERFHK